jgi:hypothetical protein
MKQIYHPYHLWEDYKSGFYNNCSGEQKKTYIQGCLNLFNNKGITEKYMSLVIENWFYSCQHNLTNPSVNKIAYIGQAACCIYCGAPNTTTMQAWNMLDKEVQERSNNIAQKYLNIWNNNLNNRQLCLNII